jgi:hypothetical protein
MDIADLDTKERLALVALLEAVIAADRSVSEEEEFQLAEIIEALGEDTYRQTLEFVDNKVEDEDDLKALLEDVDRREAQELIYATVVDVAMSDVVFGSEVPILDWVAKTWNLQVDVESLPDADS